MSTGSSPVSVVSFWKWFVVSLIVFFGWSVVAWWVAAPNPPEAMSALFLDPVGALAVVGGDAKSYLQLGIDFANGRVQPQNRWILNLWPPGMATLHAAAISLRVPPLLFILVLHVTLHAVAGGLITAAFVIKRQKIAAIAASIFFLTFPLQYDWHLTAGSAHSDGLAASMFIIALVLYIKAVKGDTWVQTLRGRQVAALASALLFVGTVFLRWVYVGAVVIVVLWAIVLHETSVISLRSSASSARAVTRRFVATICLASAPYTLFVATWLHPPNPLWSTGTDYMAAYTWFLDEDFEAISAVWLVDAGSNWGCHHYPSECQAGRALAIHAVSTTRDFSAVSNFTQGVLMAEPLPFLRHRSEFLFQKLVAFGRPTTTWLAVVSILSLAVAIAASGWTKSDRVSTASVALVCLVLVYFSVLLMLTHIEPRYLIPLYVVPLATRAAVSTANRAR